MDYVGGVFLNARGGEMGCMGDFSVRGGRDGWYEKGGLTGVRGWWGRGFKHNLYKGRVYGLNIDFLAIV